MNPDNPPDVPGWGADLDPERRPAVPMEHTPPDGTGAHWTEPEPMRTDVEVFHSIERPTMTPVFGTAVPPRGLSGVMRRVAFRYSEAQMSHWLLLLAADRVDVIEGVLEDLAHLHIPNVFAEMGLKSELAHNKARVAKVLGVAGLATAAAAGLWWARRRHATG